MVFTAGRKYKRSLLHDQYGGNRQSGICPSAKFPVIFIFTGAGGKQHGYKDEWENKNVFSYTGEGQVGDMQLTKGNLALRDHLILEKKVYLFNYTAKGIVEFVSEMIFIDFDYFDTHDRNEDLRIGIKFFFKRSEANIYAIPEELSKMNLVQDRKGIYEQMKPNITERKGLVTTRVGQGAYRKSILHRWEYQCAVTKFNDLRVLVASHIVPWKDSTDEQRLDVDNGILLSPDFDGLFDKHLISFENSGKIILSSEVENTGYTRLGISGKEVIMNLSDGNKSYLDQHRRKIS